MGKQVHLEGTHWQREAGREGRRRTGGVKGRVLFVASREEFPGESLVAGDGGWVEHDLQVSLVERDQGPPGVAGRNGQTHFLEGLAFYPEVESQLSQVQLNADGAGRGSSEFLKHYLGFWGLGLDAHL